MRRQTALVTASGASVLVVALVVGAVAHMAVGGADTRDANALALQGRTASTARVLRLPARDALSDDLWNGWAREQIAGAGYLSLPPELPLPPNAFSTVMVPTGDLGGMGDDFSWLTAFGHGFQLNSTGGVFTFGANRGGGGGFGGGGVRGPRVGGGGGGNEGGGNPDGGGSPIAFVPDPPPVGQGDGDTPGDGDSTPPVTYDPPASPEIDPPDPPDVPQGDPGNSDPTVPVNNPETPGQPAQITQVPEPGMFSLFGVAMGLLGAGIAVRRRRV